MIVKSSGELYKMVEDNLEDHRAKVDLKRKGPGSMLHPLFLLMRGNNCTVRVSGGPSVDATSTRATSTRAPS
jgi:hypothetical protein